MKFIGQLALPNGQLKMDNGQLSTVNCQFARQGDKLKFVLPIVAINGLCFGQNDEKT